MKIHCYTETFLNVTYLTSYLNTQTFESLRQRLVMHVFCFILETVMDWGPSCPTSDAGPPPLSLREQEKLFQDKQDTPLVI